MTRTRPQRAVRAALVAGIVAVGGVLLPATAAHASTESFTVSATGGANNTVAVGTATGTVTATRGGTSATYPVQLCGQSTYPSASVIVAAGTASASHSVSYQSCQTFTGTPTSTSGIQTGTVSVRGSTFYPGNTYTTYTRSGNVVF